MDAETRNRYRLRLREAVRDPSAPRASLASVRMTDFGCGDLEPVPASLARSCPRSFRSASFARFGQDDGGENEPPPFLVERRENYPEVSRRAACGGICADVICAVMISKILIAPGGAPRT